MDVVGNSTESGEGNPVEVVYAADQSDWQRTRDVTVGPDGATT